MQRRCELPNTLHCFLFLTAFGCQLFQLKDILLGQQTETFKLLHSAGLAVVSFSLVLDDRTLDCVAKSVRERRWWCAHIQFVHKMLRPQGSRAVAESVRKQLQVGYVLSVLCVRLCQNLGVFLFAPCCVAVVLRN